MEGGNGGREKWREREGTEEGEKWREREGRMEGGNRGREEGRKEAGGREEGSGREGLIWKDTSIRTGVLIEVSAPNMSTIMMSETLFSLRRWVLAGLAVEVCNGGPLPTDTQSIPHYDKSRVQLPMVCLIQGTVQYWVARNRALRGLGWASVRHGRQNSANPGLVLSGG